MKQDLWIKMAKQKKISTKPRHLDGIENDEYPLASDLLFTKKDAIFYAIMLRRNGYNARVIKRLKNKFMVYIKQNTNKNPATMDYLNKFIDKVSIEDTGSVIPTRSIESENEEILKDNSAIDIYESKDGKKILQVFPDEDPTNPREWDNFGHLVAIHRRYDLGDKGEELNSDNFEGWEEIEQHLIKEKGAKLIAPIYMYEHSGITIKIGEFSGLPQGHKEFDSGQIGFIYVTEKDIKDNYGDLSKASLEKARKLMEAEIETYDDYLTGNVYGFKLYEKDANGLLVEKDSCWGFFGDDIKSEAEDLLGKGYKDIK